MSTKSSEKDSALSADTVKPRAKSFRQRLPRYYRRLRELIGDDILRINSAGLGELMGLTASQIRQDFSAIGAEGHQGYGYNVKDLYGKLGAALGVNDHLRAVIVGNDGGLGEAIANNSCFSARGVTLSGVFCPPEKKSGRGASSPEKYIETAAEYCKSEKIEIAVVCTERASSAKAFSLLYASGVRGFWNLTSSDPSLPPDAKVIDSNPMDSLLALSFELSDKGSQ